MVLLHIARVGVRAGEISIVFVADQEEGANLGAAPVRGISARCIRLGGCQETTVGVYLESTVGVRAGARGFAASKHPGAVEGAVRLTH